MNLCLRPPCGKGKLSHFFGGFLCLRPPCGKGKLSPFFGGFVFACGRPVGRGNSGIFSAVLSWLAFVRAGWRAPSEAGAFGSDRPRKREPSGAGALGSGRPRERTPSGAEALGSGRPSGAGALGSGRPRERTLSGAGALGSGLPCERALSERPCFALKFFAPRFARKCVYSKIFRSALRAEVFVFLDFSFRAARATVIEQVSWRLARAARSSSLQWRGNC